MEDGYLEPWKFLCGAYLSLRNLLACPMVLRRTPPPVYLNFEPASYAWPRQCVNLLVQPAAEETKSSYDVRRVSATETAGNGVPALLPKEAEGIIPKIQIQSLTNPALIMAVRPSSAMFELCAAPAARTLLLCGRDD
jgi:hypothetical protein